MRKVIFLVLGAALTVAGVMGVNKFNSEELTSNDLLMENVEALSNGEIGSGGLFLAMPLKIELVLSMLVWQMDDM